MKNNIIFAFLFLLIKLLFVISQKGDVTYTCFPQYDNPFIKFQTHSLQFNKPIRNRDKLHIFSKFYRPPNIVVKLKNRQITLENRKEECEKFEGVYVEQQCFKAISTAMTFEEARIFCLSLGNEADIWVPDFKNPSLYEIFARNMPEIFSNAIYRKKEKAPKTCIDIQYQGDYSGHRGMQGRIPTELCHGPLHGMHAMECTKNDKIYANFYPAFANLGVDGLFIGVTVADNKFLTVKLKDVSNTYLFRTVQDNQNCSPCASNCTSLSFRGGLVVNTVPCDEKLKFACEFPIKSQDKIIIEEVLKLVKTIKLDQKI